MKFAAVRLPEKGYSAKHRFSCFSVLAQQISVALIPRDIDLNKGYLKTNLANFVSAQLVFR